MATSILLTCSSFSKLTVILSRSSNMNFSHGLSFQNLRCLAIFASFEISIFNSLTSIFKLATISWMSIIYLDNALPWSHLLSIFLCHPFDWCKSLLHFKIIESNSISIQKDFITIFKFWRKYCELYLEFFPSVWYCNIFHFHVCSLRWISKIWSISNYLSSAIFLGQNS